MLVSSSRLRNRLLPFQIPDQGVFFVVATAVVLSVVSLFVVLAHDLSLLYYDAQARLLITRRVVDSPTPGLAQLGSVWLPLTHLAAVPFIGIDALYHSGFALTWTSMVSFVLTAFYLYKIVHWLTRDRGAAVLGALIFMTNLNTLYMQATPMTELPMFASMAATIYYLLRLSNAPENRTWLLLCSLSIALGTLVRYEAWVLLLVEVAVLLYVFVLKRFSFSKIEALLVFWGYVAFMGVLAWLVWNTMIFGDPLSFQRGEYAKPSLWVAEGDPLIGSWSGSLLSYAYATLSTSGPLVFVALLGVLYFVVRTRFSPESVAPLALMCLFPFFVFMVYAGQRPLKVPQLSNEMYNIRFALVMLLPVAIFVGYLASSSRTAKALLVIIMIGTSALMLRDHGVITLAEPASVQETPRSLAIRQASVWLSAHYDGASMLMESYGNDELQFDSRIPLGSIVYEGSYQLWEPALENPLDYVDWVVMRSASGDAGDLVGSDKVWRRWYGDPQLEAACPLVFANTIYRIHRCESPS